MPKSAHVTGSFEPFVSPVDGTIISGPRSMREHNLRNDVVPFEEFPQSHYDEAAKKRAKFYNGEYTKEESFKNKQDIHEAIERGLRNG